LAFGYFDILFTKSNEWSPPAIFYSYLGVFFKFFDDFVYIFLSFVLNNFNGFILFYFQWVLSFRYGIEGIIMSDVWTETTNGDSHVFSFKLSGFFGKFKQVHGFIKCDGFYHLPVS